MIFIRSLVQRKRSTVISERSRSYRPTEENPFRARSKQAFDRVHELELKKTELRAELSQLEAALSRGGEREALLLLIGKQTENTAVATTSTQAVNESTNTAKNMAQVLFPLIQERAIKAAQLGPDHPRLQELDLQIDLTRRHFMDMMGAEEKPAASDDKKSPKAPPDFLAVYLQSCARICLFWRKPSRIFNCLLSEMTKLLEP